MEEEQGLLSKEQAQADDAGLADLPSTTPSTPRASGEPFKVRGCRQEGASWEGS